MNEITIGDIIGQTYPPTFSKKESILNNIYSNKKKKICKNCIEKDKRIRELEIKLSSFEKEIMNQLNHDSNENYHYSYKTEIEKIKKLDAIENKKNILRLLKILSEDPSKIKSQRDFNLLNRAIYMQIAQPFPFIPQEKLNKTKNEKTEI